MIRALSYRLLYAILLLGIISVLAFYLSKSIPGDEVLDYLSIDESGYSTSANALEQQHAYARVAHRRGLDLPYFYFSILPAYYPDTLYRVVPASHREVIKAWTTQVNDPQAVMELYAGLIAGLQSACPSADTSLSAKASCNGIAEVLSINDLSRAQQRMNTLCTEFRNAGGIHHDRTSSCETLHSRFDQLSTKSDHRKILAGWPTFRWHGHRNQYHQWMSALLTFQPLTSLMDGRNAWTKIGGALKWTLWLNGFAFILSIGLGVWIGLWSGVNDGRRKERVINMILFAFFAIPSFWLATLLIYFFSSGEWLSLFPAGGLGAYHIADSLFEKTAIIGLHLFLPVVCLALGAIAYVSRQMKQSVVNQMHQPYVFFLRAQGVSEKTILYKHIFRNALFPLITMIGSSLPALLSGSLIIEVIFSVPGMGRLLYTSLLARDWPVVFPLLMLGALVTVISYVVTDLVYRWADPRVKSIES